MITIRRYDPEDWKAVWRIFSAVVARGDTYAYDPSTTEESARTIWLAAGGSVYVAEMDRAVVGTYVLRPNQPGLGSHIANAGFMVDDKARKSGVGETMCAHALKEARTAGYRGMQFNFVVATNIGAIRLWERMGFAVVGTVPGAFRVHGNEETAVHIMYRRL